MGLPLYRSPSQLELDRLKASESEGTSKVSPANATISTSRPDNAEVNPSQASVPVARVGSDATAQTLPTSQASMWPSRWLFLVYSSYSILVVNDNTADTAACLELQEWLHRDLDQRLYRPSTSDNPQQDSKNARHKNSDS